MYTFACPRLTKLERDTRKVKLIASGELARHRKAGASSSVERSLHLWNLNQVNVLLIKILFFLFIFKISFENSPCTRH